MTSSDAVWIERFAPAAGAAESEALTVAVKDLFDVAGSITTAGCRALAEQAAVAEADAACIVALRAAGSRLLGKVNLHELAFGVTGVNPWFGTPANPADPGRIPGGSSSGSAVAVALGQADAALGSDTGGSVRIPAACCGVVGLKTTHGRVPIGGTWPLAPSFDTIGALAARVEGVGRLMGALEPGFAVADEMPDRIGRLRLGPEVEIDPVVDAAVDAALAAAELGVEPVAIDGWSDAYVDQQVVLGVEALESNAALLASTGGEGISEHTLERMERSRVSEQTAAAAGSRGAAWARSFVAVVERHAVVALPTLPCRPFAIGETARAFNGLCAPINLAGLPAISLPVPVPVAERGRPDASLQLVAAHGGEELLCAVAARIEASVAR